MKFLIKNKPLSDTLICLYTDFAAEPYGQMIIENKDYGWILPSKGYYSTSNDYIVFAKMKSPINFRKEENDIISWDDVEFYNNFEVLKILKIRIFNNEKVIVEFDYNTKKTKLTFEK